MLYTRILSRAFAIPLATRSYSSMASSTAIPPQNFTLDHTIFNDSLYSHIRSFWFAGIPPGSKHGNAESMKRWWGAGGRTEEESKAFDNSCRENFDGVLKSIGPEKLALPAFKSFEDEFERVGEVAKPFLEAVKEGKEVGHERLLSLVILLDQIPRNIYRETEGLKLVYGHYDRLAWSLVRGSAALLRPSPLEHESFRGNALAKNWLVMPLMHAEDLASQELAVGMLKGCAGEARDEETAKEVERAVGFAGKHEEIVSRFGRFPHRNECLGRESTGEEERYLEEDGETFGVKQTKKKDEGKAEL